MEFSRLLRRAAQSIRDGELRYEPVEKYLQVHHSSWEPLAQINLSGMLTFDSQDAIDAATGKAKPWERSYVFGFMLPDDALRFVNHINMKNDDKVALLCFEPKAEQSIYAEIALTRTADEQSATNVADAILTREQRANLNTLYKIPETLELQAVQVFDTKWGRSASHRNGLFNAIFRATGE